MRETNLKDCPFCGKSVSIMWDQIECDSCGAGTSTLDNILETMGLYPNTELNDEEYDALREKYEYLIVERWNSRNQAGKDHCPFCGSDDVAWHGDNYSGQYACDTCSNYGPYVDLWEMALSRYNERV